MENHEQVKSEQESQPMEEVVAPVPADVVESSIPTPITTEENSPTTPAEDTQITSAPSPVKEEEQSEELHETQALEQERSSSYPPRPAAPAPQLRRRPRRTGQPLHLLLQDCSKQVCACYNLATLAWVSIITSSNLPLLIAYQLAYLRKLEQKDIRGDPCSIKRQEGSCGRSPYIFKRVRIDLSPRSRCRRIG